MVGRSGKAIVATAVCGAAIPAFAQTNADVQSELAALRAEVAQMKAAQGETWLNERRAEEVKTLVREVLADADTRATLLQEGMSAGHDGKKFFLQSNDGSFRLNVEGQLQMRYLVNWQDGRADETEHGFQMRRTKLGFNGYIANPKLGYDIVLAAERGADTTDLGGGITGSSGGIGAGDVFVEDAIVSYEFTDNLQILGGRFKLPFSRQELMSSKRQLAVDRASVHEYFTLNRAEQVQLVYSMDMIKLSAAISDGANSGYEDFTQTPADYALTGRVDVTLAGDSKEMADVVAWEDDFALFFGVAGHYEQLSEDNTGTDGDFFALTADALVKTGSLAGLAAVYYAEADEEVGGPEDAWGAQIEAGYSLTEQWQPFARWEYLDVDGSDEELQFATVGVNYYLRNHNAKFTADVVWKYAGTNPGTLGNVNGGEFSSGQGLISSGVTDEDDQVALRAQFQLLF